MYNEATTQGQTTTQATMTKPPIATLTPVLMPIAYALSAAIVLAAIAAFLRTLFSMGKQ